MSPAKQAPKGLLASATETQQRIIDFTDLPYADDIKSIRQVCRQLADSADRAFLVRYFSKRKDFLLTDDGLRALERIVSSPQLRKNLSKITIWTLHLHESDELVEMARSRAWPPDVPREGVSLSAARLCAASRWCKQLTEQDGYEEAVYKASSKKVRLLLAILKTLGAAGQRVTLALDLYYGQSGSPMPDVPPLGVRQLERYLGLKLVRDAWAPSDDAAMFLSLSGCNYDLVTGMLIEAVADGRYPLGGLALQTRMISLRSLDSPPTTSGQERALATQQPSRVLKSLSLRIDHRSRGGPRRFDVDTEKESFDNFRFWLRGATALEDSDLDFGYDCQGNVSRRLICVAFSALATAPLTTMALSWAVTTAEQLLRFLESHKGSLKSLKLEDTLIEGDHGWKHILGVFAASFHLEDVDLESMRHKEGLIAEVDDDGDVWTCVRASGTAQAVSAEMLRFAATCVHDLSWHNDDEW